MNAYETKSCPVCRGSIVARWPAVEISQCTDCGLFLRDPPPAPRDLYLLYKAGWRDPVLHTRETGGTTVALAEVYATQLLGSLKRTDFSGLRVLDFGAGRGEFVDALKALGANVVAVDPFGYEYLRGRGITAFQCLEDIPDGERFDGIVSIDVLERLSTPLDTLANMKQYFSGKGWLFLATPNAAGLSSRLKRAQWRGVRNPGHLYLFSPRNLEMILSRAGFTSSRRLYWRIQYSRSPVRRVIHFFLQHLALDGELRYLAYAS